MASVNNEKKNISVSTKKVTKITNKKTNDSNKSSNAKTTSKKPKINKNKKIITKIIIILIFLISAVVAVTSTYKIVKWDIDRKKAQKELDEINEIISVEETTPEDDSPNVEIIENGAEKPPKANPYWDYIKMPFISIDFNELFKKNNQTVAWIKLNGTNINYPVVQSTDNSYYLTHSFDKKNSVGGWIFMDYRNNSEILNKNTIIYGHSLLDTTMFGSLKNITNTNWYSDINNHIVKLSTPTQNTLWQVFSIYIIPNTSDYLYTEFVSEDAFVQFGKMLKNRSIYSFDTDVVAGDKILTLSTCYKRVDRVVLHAKLIKTLNR